MVLFEGALGLVALAVWIFCVVDVITTPAQQVRNLPKLAWIIVIILLVDVGSISWLIAGRPWVERASANRLSAVPAGRRSARPSNPDDDEDFLAGLNARAEEQRRRAGEATGDDQPGGSTPSN